MPSLSLVLGQLGQAQSSSKQNLPPFVTSADKVDVEIRIDIGKMAREMGGPITLVHPKPPTDEYLCFNVTALLDGKRVLEDTTSDRLGRPLYVVQGDEGSGVFVIKVQGVALNRTVGPDDQLQSPASLTSYEKTLYTHMGQVPALQNAGWHAKVSDLGLKKSSTETNYDYMARISRYIQKNYKYGAPDVADYSTRPEKMFDTTYMKC